MHHISNYINFIKESNIEYYSELNEDEFKSDSSLRTRNIHKNKIDSPYFPAKIINKITEYLKKIITVQDINLKWSKINSQYVIDYVDIDTHDDKLLINTSQFRLDEQKYYLTFYITLGSDEYYGVIKDTWKWNKVNAEYERDNTLYYKCDQYEGLIKLLHDSINILKKST